MEGWGLLLSSKYGFFWLQTFQMFAPFEPDSSLHQGGSMAPSSQPPKLIEQHKHNLGPNLGFYPCFLGVLYQAAEVQKEVLINN